MTLGATPQPEPQHDQLASLWQALKVIYIHVVTRIVPGPQNLSYFAPFILLPAALLIPPRRLSHRRLALLFLVPIYACTVQAWLAMGGVDVISVDGLLWSTFFLVFKDPRRRFKRLWLVADERPSNAKAPRGEKVKRRPADRVVEEAYPEQFTKRLVWVVTLLGSTRLHRWKTGEPEHDSRQTRLLATPTRRRFVASLAPTVAVNLLIYPLIVQLARHDPSITSLHPVRDPPPIPVSLIRTTVPPALLTPLTGGLYAYLIVSSGFTFPAPLVVASNYLLGLPPSDLSPHTLPPMFGPFAAVLDHGVTGLWGTWWHQHMRLMVATPGDALADALGLDAGRDTARSGQRFARYALRVLSAFFFSGVAHMGLVPPLAEGAGALRLLVAGFFWVQPVPILVEAAIRHVSRGRGMSSPAVRVALRVLRLVWTVGWLCLSLNLLAVPCDRLGWWSGWWLWPVPGVGHFFTRYTSGDWIP